jgi:CpeT protein
MRPALTLIACLLLFTSRGLAEPSTLEHLAVFLTGSFSSADQARGDQNFRAATLHITPIWTDRSDGPWLYLEQALADAPAHPYRQLIYQLATRADHALEVRVFELSNPIAATGAWKDPALLAKLSPANLATREGCTLVLRLQPGSTFKGGTEGKGCTSTLRGANHSTIETVISNLQIVTWERGYNSAGTQVWGSIHGGYIFKRVE